MKTNDLQTLLEQSGVVRNACDLDLLLFLWRHPRALLTSDRLVHVLGYTAVQIGISLDAFLEHGLLERMKNPARAARLYVLVLDGPGAEPTRRLLDAAADPEGRRSLVRALEGHTPSPDVAVLQRRSLRVVGRRGVGDGHA